MQVTLENISGLERWMRISVPGEELETQVQAKLKQTASQARIKGFRPGKIPVKEIKRRFGEQIRQEVGSEIMQTSFAKAVQQQAVSPAGMPQIKDVSLEVGKDLEFTAVFEVFPEITLADFSNVKIERLVATITTEDIDQMIETLRFQRAEFKEIDRAAQTGDKVNINFEGLVEDKPFKEGTATAQDIIIGSDSMLPGFEESIVGMVAKEEKVVPLKYPDEYHNHELAGKEASFRIQLNQVFAAEKPELDEAFFTQFGVTEGGLEAFKNEVSAIMEKELRATIKSKVKNQVLDALLTSNELPIPKVLLNQEIDRLRHDIAHRLGADDKVESDNLPSKLFTNQAKKRVTLSLLMNAIVDQHELKADEGRVKAMIHDMASSYEEPEQLIEHYYKNEQLLKQIQGLVLEDQAIELLLDLAEVHEVEQSYANAIKRLSPTHDSI